ncbi:hypothetical protein IWW50_003145 [Coemansia erecta]|nr:hypothetical protein IWW50_003145 [Coemansia erecta]
MFRATRVLTRPFLPQSAHLYRHARYSSSSTPSTLTPVPGLDLSHERLRRTVFYVPCSEERKIQKSLATQADCVMYDLEDGVSHNRKTHARTLVTHALSACRARERGVRINAVGSGLEQEDLDVILQAPQLDVILVPKVQSPKDIHYVSRRLGEAGRRVRIIAGIETARGLLNVRAIAEADPCVDALLFAAEDYCADTGITRTRTRKELYYARSVVVNTAHAFRMQAIDMVTMDLRDPRVLEEEAREGVVMGFTGKQVIHPGQVDVVQRLFAPQPETVDRAVRIVDGYQKHYVAGKGAFDLDGMAVDMPVVKWAYRVLYRAELAGVNAAQ